MTFLLVLSDKNKVSLLPEPFIYALLHGMNTILRRFVLNHFAVPKNVCKIIALYKADSKI